MKMAVFNQLDDLKESKTLVACVLINTRDRVYFVGLELLYTYWTAVRSFRFFLEEWPIYHQPTPVRTRMDQGVFSRTKVDITSKFSCFLVFGRLPCFISFSGHFGFPGWDDPSACRARLWPWAQPRSCENPVGKGEDATKLQRPRKD